jgi:hypothetical protein
MMLLSVESIGVRRAVFPLVWQGSAASKTRAAIESQAGRLERRRWLFVGLLGLVGLGS